MLLTLKDLIQLSPGTVQYRNRRNLALEGVIEVTVCMLDPDVRRFRRDPLDGIGLFDHPIKFQMLNRCSAVTRLIVVQQPMVKHNKYIV